MGGISTKEEIIARLDELDKKELEVNLKLKDLQLELNKLVPEEERLKVNENLGPSGEIRSSPYNVNKRGRKARDEEPEEEEEEEEGEGDEEEEEEED